MEYFDTPFGKGVKNTPKTYLPREMEKKRTGLTKSGSSNVLEQGPFVRVLVVLAGSVLVRDSGQLDPVINGTLNPIEITCWGSAIGKGNGALYV